MKTRNSDTSFQDNRGEMLEVLRELDPRLSFGIGLLFCAIIAYYVPLVLIALTGVWVNNLTMLLPLLIAVTVLVVQNLIGNKLSKLMPVAIAFAVVIDCAEAYLIARTSHSFDWRVCWMLFFLPTAACILNAWLLLRFKAAADLS